LKSFTLNVLVLVATAALSTSATAQKAYKCGDSYSQSPCPGAVQIETADPRTNAQKRQTDTAASRDAKSADALQKARLQQEGKDLVANSLAAVPAAPAPTPEAAMDPGPSQLKKKKKTPEFFTAQAPGEKKKKKVAKKSVVKKVESQP
jgi:hypothetical protein